jgi:hypothetical protein
MQLKAMGGSKLSPEVRKGEGLTRRRLDFACQYRHTWLGDASTAWQWIISISSVAALQDASVAMVWVTILIYARARARPGQNNNNVRVQCGAAYQG